MPGARKNYVVELTPGQSGKLLALLQDRGWDVDDLPHAQYRARREGTTVVSYRSGKLVVQGKGTQDFVQFLLEPEVTGEARMGYESVELLRQRPEMFEPHAGIDESGKGDYFGPLVVAAVYVDRATAGRLLEAGVADSKKIGSDRKIASLAGTVRSTVGDGHSIVAIGPAAYNRLYDKIGNVNRLLAWGHARALENLLEKVPDCPRAVSDQFGRKETVQRALMAAGRRVALEQYPRAETDVAVAAASILARHEFVQRLERLGAAAGLKLPKGAGPQVVEVGRQAASAGGASRLQGLVKMHFKTTAKVLASVS
jgi:ribonuclease HIII